MTPEEFYNATNDVPHSSLEEFYASLYRLLDTKKNESLNYTLFFNLIQEALTTKAEEEIGDDEILASYTIPKDSTDSFERVKHFTVLEVQYFNKNPYEIDTYEVYYDSCFHFLASEENQLLFQASTNTWDDFISLLKTLTNYNFQERIPFHESLQSNDAISTLNFITHHSKNTLSTSDIALYAWLAEKWRMIYTDDRFIYSHVEGFNYNLHVSNSDIFQATSYEFNWRSSLYYANEDIRREIIGRIQAILHTYLSPSETTDILQAARIFNHAYPFATEIGNADANIYSYRDHIANWERDDWDLSWKKFCEYRTYFESLLSSHYIFDYEWITLAQVLWQHFRWDKLIDVEATEYFLKTAIELNPGIPIHYIDLTYYQLDKKDPKETLRHTLQSNIGITIGYYAEFLFYEKKDFENALKYYQEFVALEPSLFPNKPSRMDSRHAELRAIPFSTKEALAQIARILRM